MLGITFIVYGLSLLHPIVNAAPAVMPETKDQATAPELLRNRPLISRNPAPTPQRPAIAPEQVWLDEFENVVHVAPISSPGDDETNPPPAHSTPNKEESLHQRKHGSTTYTSPFDFLIQRYSNGVEMVDFDKYYLEGFFDGLTSIAIYGAFAAAASFCFVLIFHTIASKKGGAIRLGSSHRRGESRFSL